MAIEKYTEFNRLKFSSILFEVKSNQIEDLNENVFDGVLHTHLSIFLFVLSIFGELVSVLESNAALNPIKCIQSPTLYDGGAVDMMKLHLKLLTCSQFAGATESTAIMMKHTAKWIN